MTQKKITKLPDNINLEEIKDDWIRVGLSTEPSDRENAEKGVAAAFKEAGLNPPDEIIWVDDPVIGARKVAQLLNETPQSIMNGWCYGQHDAHWLCYYSVFKGLIKEVDRLDGLVTIARSTGWWFPMLDEATGKSTVVMVERPCELHLDEQGRMHNFDDFAIKYRSGFGICSVHGVVVPNSVILEKDKLTVEMINAEQNAEIKRVMRMVYGDERWLVDIGAKVVDVDTVPTDAVEGSGVITRALMEDKEGEKFLVGSDGSTDRVYAMQVPRTVKTCVEAYDALRGDSKRKTIMEC